MEEGRNVKWFEISTCGHCIYSRPGNNGESTAVSCTNIKSPYNPRGFESGVPLSDEEWIAGCEEFSFDGKKIPKENFEYIAHESPLRDMLQEVVKDFEEEGRISEGSYSVKDLAQLFKLKKRKERRRLENRTFEFEEINRNGII